MSITESCRDIKQLTPLAQQACNLFLSECKKQGVNVFITETYRSQARQNYLYEQGRSRPGQVVTWTKQSNHTGRMAWDIAVSPPKALYDRNEINKAGAIASRLGITWGGTWKTPDTPHFQIDSRWLAPSIKEAIKDNQYEKAVQDLVNLDIIGSPAAWLDVNKITVNNIKSLIIKFAKKIDSSVKDYDSAVDVLVKVKIISNKQAWNESNINVKNAVPLIIKMSAYLTQGI